MRVSPPQAAAGAITSLEAGGRRKELSLHERQEPPAGSHRAPGGTTWLTSHLEQQIQAQHADLQVLKKKRKNIVIANIITKY